VNQSELKVS
jgi:molybdopterin synthase sulfur carrier subunit